MLTFTSMLCMVAGSLGVQGDDGHFEWVATNFETNIPVPDGGGFATFEVDYDFYATPLMDLQIGIIISSTWQGDVEARIQGPFGTPLTLVDQPGDGPSGFSNDNFGNPATGDYMFFWDYAATPYGVDNVGIDNVVGEWRPLSGEFWQFLYQDISGTWTLSVHDHQSLDFTTIRGLSIREHRFVPEPSVLTLLGFGVLFVGRSTRSVVSFHSSAFRRDR